MGRDDATPMIRVSGAGAPSEIWHGFMAAALKRVPVRAIPPGPPAPIEAVAPPALPLPVGQSPAQSPETPPT